MTKCFHCHERTKYTFLTGGFNMAPNTSVSQSRMTQINAPERPIWCCNHLNPLKVTLRGVESNTASSNRGKNFFQTHVLTLMFCIKCTALLNDLFEITSKCHYKKDQYNISSNKVSIKPTVSIKRTVWISDKSITILGTIKVCHCFTE